MLDRDELDETGLRRNLERTIRVSDSLRNRRKRCWRASFLPTSQKEHARISKGFARFSVDDAQANHRTTPKDDARS